MGTIKNVTKEILERSLELINLQIYDGNVEFNRFEATNAKQTRFRVTLRVKSSKGKGAKLGYTRNKNGERRRTVAACWHVHGHFFEAVLGLEEDAVIKVMNRTIDQNGGNWQDRQIGSMLDPLWYSEACHCEYVKKVEVKQINQSEMSGECWLVQFSGLKACANCEAKDTDDCGGKAIRKRLKESNIFQNEKGFPLPLGNLME